MGFMWEQFEAESKKSDKLLLILEQMEPENLFKKMVRGAGWAGGGWWVACARWRQVGRCGLPRAGDDGQVARGRWRGAGGAGQIAKGGWRGFRLGAWIPALPWKPLPW